VSNFTLELTIDDSFDGCQCGYKARWNYYPPRSFKMIPYSSEASSISSIALVLRASRKADDASVPSSMWSGPRDLCLIYKMSKELKDRMDFIVSYHCRIVKMSNNLRQDRLCLVSERFIWGSISMCCELEGFGQLPLEVYPQADWDLVAGKTRKQLIQLNIDEWLKQKKDEHILRGHLNLVFSESVYSPESDIGIGDHRLTSTK